MDDWKWKVSMLALALAWGGWWVLAQSNLLPLKDGPYECKMVRLSSDEKYITMIVEGSPVYGTAHVTDNRITSINVEGEDANMDELDTVWTYRKGRKHFRIEPKGAQMNRDALACDAK